MSPKFWHMNVTVCHKDESKNEEAIVFLLGIKFWKDDDTIKNMCCYFK